MSSSRARSQTILTPSRAPSLSARTEKQRLRHPSSGNGRLKSKSRVWKEPLFPVRIGGGATRRSTRAVQPGAMQGERRPGSSAGRGRRHSGPGPRSGRHPDGKTRCRRRKTRQRIAQPKARLSENFHGSPVNPPEKLATSPHTTPGTRTATSASDNMSAVPHPVRGRANRSNAASGPSP